MPVGGGLFTGKMIVDANAGKIANLKSQCGTGYATIDGEPHLPLLMLGGDVEIILYHALTRPRLWRVHLLAGITGKDCGWQEKSQQCEVQCAHESSINGN